MWSEKAKGKVGFFDWYLPSMGCMSLASGNRPPYDIDKARFEAMKKKMFSLKSQSSGFYTIADIFSSMTNGRALIIPGIGEWITLGLRTSGVPVDTIIPDEGGLQYTESLSIVKGTAKRDLARKFIQYSLTPRAQVRWPPRSTTARAFRRCGLEAAQRHQAARRSAAALTLKGPNVMDEYRPRRSSCASCPNSSRSKTGTTPGAVQEPG